MTCPQNNLYQLGLLHIILHSVSAACTVKSEVVTDFRTPGKLSSLRETSSSQSHTRRQSARQPVVFSCSQLVHIQGLVFKRETNMSSRLMERDTESSGCCGDSSSEDEDTQDSGDSEYCVPSSGRY